MSPSDTGNDKLIYRAINLWQPRLRPDLNAEQARIASRFHPRRFRSAPVSGLHPPPDNQLAPSARNPRLNHQDDGAAPMTQNYTDYVLAEIRCAAMRAGLARADITAVGIVLANGTINVDRALDILSDCDCLSYIEPTAPAKKVAS